MRRSVMRRSLVVVTALAMTATLAACGGGNKPEGSGGGGGGASAWALTGGSEAVFKSSFERWNADHPNEKINVEWFANDSYKEKIRTAVGSGNAPTLIFSWGGGTLADYVKNGSVDDITSDVSDLTGNIFPSVVENGQVDGKTYAVPNNQSQPAILYYNKKLFDKAGVKVPTTFDELLTAVKKLKAAGVIPIALAGQSVWPELMYLQYLTDRIGGPEVFQKILDGKAGAWSDPAIVEAVSKIQELVKAGAFGGKFGSVSADAGADTALVYTGKAAMVLQGAWVYPDFQNNAPDFVSSGSLGFANFPAVAGGKGDASDITGNVANFWSISSKASASAKKAAIDYMKAEAFSDKTVDDFLSQGAVPPLKGLDEKISNAKSADYLTFVYDMVKNAKHFQLSWDQALPAAQAQTLLDNLSQIFLGKITPQQFVTTMNGTLG